MGIILGAGYGMTDTNRLLMDLIDSYHDLLRDRVIHLRPYRAARVRRCVNMIDENVKQRANLYANGFCVDIVPGDSVVVRDHWTSNRYTHVL